MVANIRVIPTIKKYEGSFYVPNLASKQTSQDFVSPLLDFEPKYASCEVAGALIFNGSEKWNGTTDYNNGVQTLKCYREQIGSLIL
ncbi:hypothetical protein [Lysinibacillus pakistanensis]|uniref:Uncharacterized protein n=1 Tax=Lysinibacillus pakistanensis TaxID=759811 RepID=A0AAX3WWP1_9BACI|nr:hypothetical protein [Lysinibacillus pakistanensis]MDM5230166.1 hypothetical protein [Lysinibacillus pakistanensis]WHY45760.1 hypothetical protein QNH22_21170 [Lysinibacillus pakistanensis]WHY50770.1 hypothetical protein QNH24_21135 [Lysinibacillus pakistanensis]